MKKMVFIGIILVMTALFYGCVKDLHDSGISESTVLKGRVLEESEREPLVNIIVTVTNGTTDYANTKTNNEGRFELTVNYNNFDGGNYLFLNSGSSGITKRIDLKGMGQESYNYGDIFLYNKNDGATPTITTRAVKDITSNGAVCGGNITSDGGAEVNRRGLCWSVSENPTVSNSNVSCGSGSGEFTGAITGLTPNTTYHVRAFATNAIGTSYGEDRHFTTANGGGSATKPTVTTKAVSTISTNSAECGGDVTSDGGSTVTERGLCWAKASTTHNPTISNFSVKDNGVGTGSFSCTMSSLLENTDYYVRAYAKNSVDISYGDPVPFTTLSGNGGGSAPTVETGIVTNITTSSATCSGVVTSDGGSGWLQRGICWSTSPNPRIPTAPWGTIPEPNGTEYVFDDGSGTGSFSCNMTNLSPDTRYYVCAFAQNLVDTSYGEDVPFNTLDNNTYPPEVVTWTVDYNSSNNTAECKGMLYSNGSSTVNDCGFCWGTSQNITIENNPNVVYGNLPGSSGMFTCTITGLVSGTTYYVRAFATNSFDTGYGQAKLLVVPGGGGGTAPSAPTGVSATVSGSRIRVSWNSVTNADEYLVYWSNDGNSYSYLVGTTTDTFIYDGEPYEDNYYKVKAKNSYGESPFSSPAYCHYSSGGGGGGGQTYTYTFESSTEDWHQIDADGDGNTWGRYYGTSHNNSSYCVGSESYINDVGPLFPDNYLYSPQRFEVSNGAKISFYVRAQDANYPAEHYGVAISTASTPTASSFVTIWEETLSAKSTTVQSGDMIRGNRGQGNWYLKTIDLSAYDGMSIWIAIRHFDCTDQYRINVDDITIVTGNRSSEGLKKGCK